MIVADTNLVAYLLIEGQRTQAAREVWQKDHEWCLPPLWRSEFLNVLTTSVRSNVISETQAIQAWRTGLQLVGHNEQEPLGEPVLHTALRYKISAYDAQFVSVAESLNIPLVTVDRKLISACKGVAVSIESFAEL
jgi:predicted nucleic acid-binding protein